MSINGPSEMTSKVNRGRLDGGFLGLVRAAALIAVVAGAGGSVGLMLHAGQRTPRLLLVLMASWVLSPFMVLVWANAVSKHWSVLTRATLYAVTLVVSLGGLAVYGDDALGHRTAHPAFV